MEKPVGMYSEQAKERYGSVIWVDADGIPYEITAFIKPSEYKWTDAVIVTEKSITFHSRHTEGSSHFRF